jgi:DNA-binding transcriptional LysR family regulator
MDYLNDLYLLTRIVEAGGFSSAERETGIPKSRLSRRISVLEERLGVRLLNRSAHSFSVTATGEVVYRHAKSMLVEAEAAEAAVRAVASEPSGVLRIAAPVLFGEAVLPGVLAAFSRAYPKVRIALSLANRLVDLATERVDLALWISAGGLDDSDIIARRLVQVPSGLMVSPLLLERIGTPNHPADLDGFWCLGFSGLDSGRRWSFRSPAAETVEFDFNPRFTSDNLGVLKEVAVQGGGIAYLPRYACRAELDAGYLVELMPGWMPAPPVAYGLYQSRRGATSAVRALLDYLDAVLPEALSEAN